MNSSVEERHAGFWPRFGLGQDGPDFAGQTVLEIGSGNGERTLEIAERGARRVIGIDPDEASVATARERLAKVFPQNNSSAIEYHRATIDTLGDEEFDAVVSEASFEHILDVPATIEAIRQRLRIGGRAYIGFGPLYHSPIGDHGWMRAVLPFGDRFPVWWGHLLVPERWLLRRIERKEGSPAPSTFDWPYLPLNKITARQYRQMFLESKLRVELLRSNANYSRKGRIFGRIGQLPMLDKYFTLNMYVILERVDP